MSKFASYKTNLIFGITSIWLYYKSWSFWNIFLQVKYPLTVKYADSLCVWHNVTQTSWIDRKKLSRRGHQCVIEDMLLYYQT